MYDVAAFTLYGMNAYFEKIESPLFASIHLYAGGTYGQNTEYEQVIPAINKNVLVEEIIENWGEFPCWRNIPDLFKANVIRFFEKNYDNFAKMWTALHLEYNPIYNVERYENGKNTYNSYHEETDRRTWTDESKEEPVGKETHNTTHATNEINETKVAADNVDEYNKKEYVTTTLAPDKTEITFENRKTTTTTTRKNPDGTDKNDHKGYDDNELHVRGNIGVTSSVELLRQEISLREFDFYKRVAELFAHELLLLIY